ncbi:dienelactone hydrolase family protein [Bacillus glycinifermentans]|uniref:dienelactone hydrolase family protein n=1 Tax=Bacillus glycinifermentans TaxID=1664069 RepID=UPI001FF30EEF|nr:dienelactone hydrolase family protein [Bacillus glycinifermentans]UOY90392.1 dienelactone hydrolase family protein [Bacillus glycinifermentans]
MRGQLLRLLGDLPDQTEIQAKTLKKEEKDSFILETLLLGLNGIEPVPAYFVKPKQAQGKLPVVLYCHSHGGRYERGRKELIEGAEYLERPPYAEELTSLGFAALAIDHWAFGDRRGKTESEIFKEMLWTGRVMWGMMVYDSIRALDYLETRNDTDTGRMAVLGMSMGGLMAWWTAALDARISACVDICSQVDSETLIKTQNLDRHNLYSYVPGLVKHVSTAQIQSLIAPRPHLSLVGTADKLTPVMGIDIIEKSLTSVYKEKNAGERYEVFRSHSGHLETAAMRQKAIDFLKTWL